MELGQRMANRQLLRIAGKGPGDEGAHDVVQNLLVKTSAHESGDALVHRGVASLDQGLAEYRQLGGVGKEPGGEQLGRSERQADQLAPADDVPGARLGG